MTRRNKKKQEQQEYYTLAPILREKAHYNIIIGERSNGKTYSVLQKIVTDYAREGHQAALLRRMQEDFIGKRGAGLFEPLIDNGEIEKATNGAWTSVYYYASRWFLCKYEEDKKGNTERITDTQPFLSSSYLHRNQREA